MASEKGEEEDRGVSSSFPLTPIHIDKKNRSNLIDITDRLEREKKSDRVSVSVYLSKSIWGGWKNYCAHAGVPHHSVTESALIEYMRSHPLPQVTLSMVQDLKAFAPDVKDRLRNKIIKDKLRVTMATLCRIQESGRGDQQVFRKQLQKLALQATNLKRPDSELLELLGEAEQLL